MRYARWLKRGATLFIALLAFLAVYSFSPGSQQPNIVVIVTESTRADHLPCYGYHRNTTPAICELAEDGILFEQAYSQGSWTALSVPQMLTGYPPNSVGRNSENWRQELNTSLLTYPEYLGQNGYRTSTNLESHLGLINLLHNISKSRTPLQSVAGSEPFFRWIWKQNSHSPYSPPTRYRKWGGANTTVNWISNDSSIPETASNLSPELLNALYDADLRYVDEGIRNATEWLKRTGRYDETLIIYTSDHGELLGEHGLHARHVVRPYRETIHVPLIIKLPQQQHAGMRIDRPVRTVDIFPTVLDYIDRELKRPIGDSLLPLLTGSSGYDPPIYSAQFSQRNWTLLTGNRQYFLDHLGRCRNGTAASSLTVMSSDDTLQPMNETGMEQRSAASALCSIYRSSPRNFIIGEDSRIDAVVKENLQNLGYLD